MEEKEVTNRTRANRVLYLVIAIVLALTALIAGIAASVTGGRGEVPLPSSPSTDAPSSDAPSTDTGVTPEPELVFTVPISGSILRGHDLTLPVWSPTLAEFRAHTGIDIACEAGASVTAAEAGEIIEISDHPLLGRSITIAHGGGYVTVYRNLSREMPEGITVGAAVERGTVLGTVGDTAMIECADEAHLHLEFYRDEAAIDPLDYLDEASVNSSLGGDTVYED